MRIVLAGGAELYAQTMPLARQLDITYVRRAVDGDAYFPAIDRSIWHETAREEHAAPAAAMMRLFAFVSYRRLPTLSLTIDETQIPPGSASGNPSRPDCAYR